MASYTINLPHLIEKATPETSSEPDWGAFMNICDLINSNQQLTKEFLKEVKKRIKHKKPRVQINALALLATLVKNCHSTNPIVGSKEWQKTLFEMATSKKVPMEVQEKVVDMISMFAQSFRQREDLPLFEQTYINLKRTGIDAPMMDHASPAFIPPDVKKPESPRPAPIPKASPAPTQESSAHKSSQWDFYDSASSSAELLEEMLRAFDPSERIQSNEIISELLATCRQNQSQLLELVQVVTDGNLLEKLLGLNDELQQLYDLYEQISKGERISASKPSSNPNPTSSSSSSSSTLIDLGESPLQIRKDHQQLPPVTVPTLSAPPEKIVRRGRRSTGADSATMQTAFGNLSLGTSSQPTSNPSDDPFAAIASRNVSSAPTTSSTNPPAYNPFVDNAPPTSNPAVKTTFNPAPTPNTYGQPFSGVVQQPTTQSYPMQYPSQSYPQLYPQSYPPPYQGVAPAYQGVAPAYQGLAPAYPGVMQPNPGVQYVGLSSFAPAQPSGQHLFSPATNPVQSSVTQPNQNQPKKPTVDDLLG